MQTYVPHDEVASPSGRISESGDMKQPANEIINHIGVGTADRPLLATAVEQVARAQCQPREAPSLRLCLHPINLPHNQNVPKSSRAVLATENAYNGVT